LAVLYQLHDWQRSLLRPASDWAQGLASLYTNPLSPLSYSPLSRRIAASLELAHRLGKDYEKPAWRIDSVETSAGTMEVRVTTARSLPFCNLLHFQKHHASRKNVDSGPKVLIVAPLSGHHATLLRDTVRTLLSEHDVYITDWIDARMVPLVEGDFHLDDYVAYIEEFIRLLSPSLHVISVCQPTVPVLAAVSLMASRGEPQAPLTMTMMGGPIDTRVGETKVNDLAKSHTLSWFDRNVIFTVPQRYPGHLRRVYPGFLQHAGFIAMNPARHASSHWDFFRQLLKGDDDQSVEAHREFYDEYNAVLDLAGEFYLDTIKTVFQEHLLPRGLWDVKGERVRPHDITRTALLTIEGEFDDISGRGQTEAAHELCSGIPQAHRKHALIEGAGHYGIFSGKRWRSVVAPTIAQFIAAHPSPLAPAAGRRGKASKLDERAKAA